MTYIACDIDWIKCGQLTNYHLLSLVTITVNFLWNIDIYSLHDIEEVKGIQDQREKVIRHIFPIMQ